MGNTQRPYIPADGGLGIKTAPTDGQIPIGNTSTGLYGLAQISAGSGAIKVTNGAGSISLDVGTVTIGQGGTGLTATPADGQIDIGNTSTGKFVRTTLTAGSGISITNAGGSITIANTGGTIANGAVAGAIAFYTGTTAAITSASYFTATHTTGLATLTVGDGTANPGQITLLGATSGAGGFPGINIGNLFGSFSTLLRGGNPGGNNNWICPAVDVYEVTSKAAVAGQALIATDITLGHREFGAINLAGGTSIVSGILPPANGGMGTSTAPTATQLAIGQSGGTYTPTTVSGDVTIGASGVTAIGSARVTNAMLATMATNTVKGNVSGSTASPSDLTGAQMHALLAAGVFKSANLTPTLSSVYGPTAHGLGYKPNQMWATLTCTVANLGYAVGDIVTIFPSSGDGASGYPGFSMYATSTNLGAALSVLALSLVPKGGGAPATITVADWTLNFYCGY